MATNLVEDNMKLAYYIAHRFDNVGYGEKEELCNYALYGLVRAAKGFDPAKGFNFSTYATRCIENEILMYLRRERRHIQNVSMHAALVTSATDGTELSYADTLMDERDYYEEVDNTILLQDILKRIEDESSLGRDNLILKYHYVDGMSQFKIADKVGLAQSYVSRILKKAVNKLGEQVRRTAIA